MKKLVPAIFALLLGVYGLALPASAADAPSVSAQSMVLMEVSTGRLLTEKNGDSPRLIASTTKLMTALLASESGNMEGETTVREEWTRVEGSSMYLRAGERCTLRELVTGLLLASGNDAALAIAETVCSSAEEFVLRMNERSAELGMEHTHYANPHGLDHEEHYSTARDLAVLMRECLRHEELREIMSLPSAVLHDKYYVNHNRLLTTCPGVVAGKTGYTQAAGRCLVSVCQRDGMELIAVTLSDPKDWEDHAALYDWGYRSYSLVTVPASRSFGSVSVLGGDADPVAAVPEEEITFCVSGAENWTADVFLLPIVPAPGTDEIVGTVRIRENNVVLREFPLFAAGG